MTPTDCAELCWAGLDVAKDTFDAAWAAPALGCSIAELRALPARTFARTPQGVHDFLQWSAALMPAPEPPARAVMEATGAYSTQLAAWLVEARPQLRPAIANPKRTADFIKSLGLRNKTDRLDARALALYGLDRRPAPYEPLSPERSELRGLLRYRDALVHERVAENNRAGETEQPAFVRALQKRRLGQLDRDIEKLEQQARKLIRQHPPLTRDLTLLETIYGVGFLTAALILAELGDLRRFAEARQLTAFAGLSPRIVQSGKTRRGTHLCKQGNGRVRQALYLAAVTATRGNTQLAHDYQHMVARGMPPKVALGAFMRKLLTVMRAVLVHQTPYQPFPNHRGKTGGKP
jgi:transposase